MNFSNDVERAMSKNVMKLDARKGVIQDNAIQGLKISGRKTYYRGYIPFTNGCD